MANPNTASLPLYEKVARKNTIQRILDLIILSLLLSLLVYRLNSLGNHGLIFPWLLAFFCEFWFAFIWVLTISTKWTPVDFKTYPQRLLQRVSELAPVDMFVTTADPVLEPPIITVNTVLSLLAVDYPAHKLACYVSDDGCSPLTFYSLVEASKFAKLWVPFCKKYNVQVRAPFRYFLSESVSQDSGSFEFQQEWKIMKDEYKQLSQKIENAAQTAFTPADLTGDFTAFSNSDRRNHPTIIKVIWENKGDFSDGLPHLIYISREKRPKHPHHNKAGAMNALTRVSGVMTNAPFMLNVDCDMFANNPQIVSHAMCLLLGTKSERESGFVQYPQRFYDGLKDDPFGNQLIVLFNYVGIGIVGIQGPLYAGTGCFHRRKVIYGLSPDDAENEKTGFSSANGKFVDENLVKLFGNSKEFAKSVVGALNGKTDRPNNISKFEEAAYQAAGCGYEHNTSWGSKVGWVYGSMSEDVLTGLRIHSMGWRSSYCSPDPHGFLGCAPSGGSESMTQQKRWATGLLEILFSHNNPIFGTLTGKLQFRQCLAYLWVLLWAIRSIPELCYTLLPAYCLITNSHFLPKVQEPAALTFTALLVIYNLYTLSEFLRSNLSIRSWWNTQRMGRINTLGPWLFGVQSVILKLLGLSETVFEVTQKDQPSSSDGVHADAGRFTFDASPIFVPGTTVLLVHLTALITGLLQGLQPPARGGHGFGVGEVVCSVWVVLWFWPFMRGIFGKGKYGIPWSTICKSATLALLFFHFCKRVSVGLVDAS